MNGLQCMSSFAWRKLVAAAIALGTLGGCGSDTRQVNAPPPQPPKSAQVSASGSSPAREASSAMQAAPTSRALREELVASQRQIDKTLASLGTLRDPATTDLRAAYDDYSNQLARMTDHADQLRREAEAMRETRNAYFAQWEEKVSEIDNPTIRASAEARQNKLRESHERISRASGQAKDAYEPFMRDLQDVRRFLGGDLSKQSVSMLGDVQKKAAANGATVKEKIGVVIRELDAIEAAAR